MAPNAHDLSEIREQLIQNAFRWLRRGLDSFDRYDEEESLTILYCATCFELMAKALVFYKRWELIFAEPGEADLLKLSVGKARTIGLEQAEKRLTNVLGVKCDKEFRSFKRIGAHRNKIVHFYHPDLESQKMKAEIAAEIIAGWAALLLLLKRDEFRGIVDFRSKDFTEVESRLLSLEPYLNSQASLIRETHSSPDELVDCPFCHRGTYDADGCLLCGSFEESDADIMRDGADYVPPADCPECGLSESVARLTHGGARCSNAECSQYFEVFGICEWCQSSYVEREAESEDVPPEDRKSTNLTGCHQCGGMIGHLSSKDD